MLHQRHFNNKLVMLMISAASCVKARCGGVVVVCVCVFVSRRQLCTRPQAAEAAYQSTVAEMRSLNDRQRVELEEAREQSLSLASQLATVTQSQTTAAKELQVCCVIH